MNLFKQKTFGCLLYMDALNRLIKIDLFPIPVSIENIQNPIFEDSFRKIRFLFCQEPVFCSDITMQIQLIVVTIKNTAKNQQ